MAKYAVLLIVFLALISGILNETTPKLVVDDSKTILVNKCCEEDEIFHESQCVKASSREVTGELNWSSDDVSYKSSLKFTQTSLKSWLKIRVNL